MKKSIIYILISLLLFTSSSFAGATKEYGVFIGMNKNKVLKLKGYDVLVVDAQYLSARNIKRLHKSNKKIYSYLNVGSIENFRPYYSKFKSIILGKYEDWPEESWVDVSSGKWQKFMFEKGEELRNKGIDGFFVDNADIYHISPKQKIYNGLTTILKSLKTQSTDIIVNGGDAYVLKTIKNNRKPKYIDGINQETVFSKIDFENSRLLKQSASSKSYYKSYCRRAKRAKLSVHLLEYTKSKSLIRKISRFCRAKGYKYYVSSSIELDQF